MAEFTTVVFFNVNKLWFGSFGYLRACDVFVVKRLRNIALSKTFSSPVLLVLKCRWRAVSLRFADHVTKRNRASGNENVQSALRSLSIPMFTDKRESTLFITNPIPNLWGLSNSFFQQLHWFFQLWSCFIKRYKKEPSTKLLRLRIHNGGCLETLNLLHISEVLHGVKQKLKQLSRMRSSDWKLLLNTLQRLINRIECTSHDVCASRKMSTRAF